MKQQQSTQGAEYIATLDAKYRTARFFVLVLFVCTIINIVTLIFGIDSFFLFSAFIPYLLVIYGNLFVGRLPADYYDGLNMEELTFLPTSFLVGMICAAVFVALLYLLSWFFAKNQEGNWLLFTLVFYALDTIVMIALFGIDLTMLLHYVMHGIAIGLLASGTIAGRKHRAYLRAQRREASRPEVRSRYLEDE